MEKRRRRFALPAQSKMRLGTHDDAIVRLIDCSEIVAKTGERGR